jgi:hypothetical protein
MFILLISLSVCEEIIQNSGFLDNPDVLSYRAYVTKGNIETIERHNKNKSRTFDMKAHPQFVGRTV